MIIVICPDPAFPLRNKIFPKEPAHVALLPNSSTLQYYPRLMQEKRRAVAQAVEKSFAAKNFAMMTIFLGDSPYHKRRNVLFIFKATQ